MSKGWWIGNWRLVWWGVGPLWMFSMWSHWKVVFWPSRTDWRHDGVKIVAYAFLGFELDWLPDEARIWRAMRREGYPDTLKPVGAVATPADLNRRHEAYYRR